MKKEKPSTVLLVPDPARPGEKRLLRVSRHGRGVLVENPDGSRFALRGGLSASSKDLARRLDVPADVVQSRLCALFPEGDPEVAPGCG